MLNKPRLHCFFEDMSRASAERTPGGSLISCLPPMTQRSSRGQLAEGIAQAAQGIGLEMGQCTWEQKSSASSSPAPTPRHEVTSLRQERERKCEYRSCLSSSA